MRRQFNHRPLEFVWLVPRGKVVCMFIVCLEECEDGGADGTEQAGGGDTD